jgi:type I site-specific restriction endonuclease
VNNNNSSRELEAMDKTIQLILNINDKNKLQTLEKLTELSVENKELIGLTEKELREGMYSLRFLTPNELKRLKNDIINYIEKDYHGCYK